MKSRDLTFLIVALVLLEGCRLSYHLQGRGGTAILIPPVPPVTSPAAPSVFLVRVSNARSHIAILDGCDIENDLLGLRWLGRTAEIRLKSESYFPAPGDERPEETGPRVYLDSVQSVEAFRSALEDRAIRGCLRSDEAQALIRAIVERLPFPPLFGHLIRFGGGATVDLTADFRMKVVSPVRSDDRAKDIVGFQIAYYRLDPAPKDARVKVSLSSISAGTLAFPASFLFYRLLFRTANSPTDHLATILSADDQATLNKATSRLELERDLSCAVLSMPGVHCATPAPEVSINLEFAVSVNRKQVFVPLSGTLSDAMPPGQGAVRIRRRFRGHLRKIEFNPGQDMRRFMLMPGDEISYTP